MNRLPCRLRGHRRFAAALLLVGLSMAGCQTLSQDLDAMAKSISPPTPGEAARMMVDPNDPDRRRVGTTLIANSDIGGFDPYVRLYRDRIENEPDVYTRAVSVRALARWGKVDDAVLIASMLRSDERQIRIEAARGLQRLHNPEIIDEMLRSLADENQDVVVRAALARGLGQYPEDRAFQGLVAALDAPELSVNLQALESLRLITGEDKGLDPIEWLAWYEEAPEPFANAREYLFPTYSRDVTFFEKLAFWAPKTFEQPAPPVGLQAKGARTTYEEDTP
jgi:hypothetical protein